MKWTDMNKNPVATDFQTPPEVCKYMVDMVPERAVTILEPTPGEGNLVHEIISRPRLNIYTPNDFFQMNHDLKFDCVVMNPPFSSKSAFGIPDDLEKLGMRFGYHILSECMKKSDSIIALMPWFTITDSDVRLREIKAFGLKSITALPRKTFGYARIQTCIFEMRRGWTEDTIFKMFEY